MAARPTVTSAASGWWDGTGTSSPSGASTPTGVAPAAAPPAPGCSRRCPAAGARAGCRCGWRTSKPGASPSRGYNPFEMSLEAGSRVGRYEIRAPLGKGGMGEVYRAHDPQLGRDVALKILPVEVASDAERMRRFVQEAKAASSLNHPNILTVHEIGGADPARFIAAEFVDGVTLRERL